MVPAAVPDPDEIVQTMRATVARLRLQLTEAANVQLATALPTYRHYRRRPTRPDPDVRAA